jgi:hypothetical protein
VLVEKKKKKKKKRRQRQVPITTTLNVVDLCHRIPSNINWRSRRHLDFDSVCKRLFCILHLITNILEQYIDSLSTNFPVVAMMKKWVKGGRQQVWTDATDQQQHSNDLSERNETESSTRRRNNNYNGRIPVIQLSDSPPPTAKNLAHHSLPDADDSGLHLVI